jgi:hypothetical protein
MFCFSVIHWKLIIHRHRWIVIHWISTYLFETTHHIYIKEIGINRPTRYDLHKTVILYGVLQSGFNYTLQRTSEHSVEQRDWLNKFITYSICLRDKHVSILFHANHLIFHSLSSTPVSYMVNHILIFANSISNLCWKCSMRKLFAEICLYCLCLLGFLRSQWISWFVGWSRISVLLIFFVLIF